MWAGGSLIAKEGISVARCAGAAGGACDEASAVDGPLIATRAGCDGWDLMVPPVVLFMIRTDEEWGRSGSIDVVGCPSGLCVCCGYSRERR